MNLDLNHPVGDFSPIETKGKTIAPEEFQRSLYAQYVGMGKSRRLDTQKAQKSELRTSVDVRFEFID